MNLLKKLCFSFLFFISPLCASDRSSVEQNIVSQVKKDQRQQLSLLEQLVNINSGTNNIPGVRAVGRILQAQFVQLGFTTRWVKEPASMRRAPTLIAERKGKQGKRLLLIGHLDTVFPKNSAFQKFTRREKRAFGPGVTDDKGGLVVILYALKALYKVHALDNTTVTVVLTGDEEDSGKPTSISRKPLFEVAEHSDIALDFECSITQDTATIARRGISMWALKTQGVEAHSAEIFKGAVGYGAVYELSRILNAFREQLDSIKGVSLNSALVLGGTQLHFDKHKAEGSASGKENVVAKVAMATGDLRFVSTTQKKELMEKMSTLVAQNLAHTQAEISFQDGIPAMSPTSANTDLLEKYSKVSQDLGYGAVSAVPVGSRGAGDISHIAERVPANLAGLGPLGADLHSVKESLNIPSLPVQTKRTAVFIYRLTR